MDSQIADLLRLEVDRQTSSLELIPSENYTSKAVQNLLGSVLVNKYSEGYAGKRYYGGNEYIDEIESLAISRAMKLFDVPFANVQPYSGSPANLALMMSVLSPGDKIMGMDLSHGGHLTHGYKISSSGLFYDAVSYGIKPTFSQVDDLFDYDEILTLAKAHRPKLIWVGASAFPKIIHYEKFAQIAQEVDAFLVADIAHIAGLIAAGVHPSPTPHVHAITTTTHKTLRGPRGAIIMATAKGMDRVPDLDKRINSAVFPGLQGGPHNNTTAAIAQALFEASTTEFALYAKQILRNNDLLSRLLLPHMDQIGGISSNHLILADLTSKLGSGNGIVAEKALDAVGLTINKNSVPNDTSSPFFPSGIRLGTPALTTRGMQESEIEQIAKIIIDVLDFCQDFPLPSDKTKRIEFIKKIGVEFATSTRLQQHLSRVHELCTRFPLP